MTWNAVVRDFGAAALHWSGWSQPRRRLVGRLSIATFHRVLSEAERAEYPLGGLAVTPEELAAVLEFLREHFTCTTLADAVERWATAADLERPLLALTFDDGQLDNWTRALPVLDSLGLSATFFVVAGAAEDGRSLWHDRLSFALDRALRRDPSATRALLSKLFGTLVEPLGAARVVELAKQQLPLAGPREAWIAELERAAGGAWRPTWDGMMRFDDLRALHAAGHEIGSHSLSHPLLPRCDDRELEHELRESKLQIERELGGEVSSFCYPNGSYDARVAEAVRKAGYARAVTTEHGWNSRGSDRFVLRRCDLSYVHCVDRHGRPSPARMAWRLGRTGA